MKRFLALAAIIAPVALSAIPAGAAPQQTLSGINAKIEAGLATPVQWRRCGFWRRECAVRWPGLGWRFRRCLAIHGCI
jgi:hypothetical protein